LPYIYRKGPDGKWYIHHRVTGKKAVKTGYATKAEAKKVGGLREYYGDKRNS
jgi:hypothetical protein